MSDLYSYRVFVLRKRKKFNTTCLRGDPHPSVHEQYPRHNFFLQPPPVNDGQSMLSQVTSVLGKTQIICWGSRILPRVPNQHFPNLFLPQFHNCFVSRT